MIELSSNPEELFHSSYINNKIILIKFKFKYFVFKSKQNLNGRKQKKKKKKCLYRLLSYRAMEKNHHMHVYATHQKPNTTNQRPHPHEALKIKYPKFKINYII